ncbi:MAG TPA: hypothetical protein VK779_03795 [Rhizomicrobium sp.]|nr:hypothetical protein [Rhizomicrobium sp.]
MSRTASLSIAAMLVAGAAYAAPAPDSAASVLHDCSADSLPPDQVDSCLERTRVLDESNPDPKLQSLEVKLSQMEAKQPPRALGTSTNSPPSSSQDDTEIQEVAPPDTPPPAQASAPDSAPQEAHIDANGRDTSDDDIDPSQGPPTDAEMHPYSQDAPARGN